MSMLWCDPQSPIWTTQADIAVDQPKIQGRRHRGCLAGNLGTSRGPGLPNTLFGTYRFRRISALTLWPKTIDWPPQMSHFPSLAPALKFLWRRPCLNHTKNTDETNEANFDKPITFLTSIWQIANI